MIKTYDKNNEATKLLKQAIDVFANGEMVHDSLSRSAHMKGLQGFKRWHREQSRNDRESRVKLQHYTIDLFEENLEPSWDYSVKESIDLKEHLEQYLDWEISVYVNLGVISNQLVAKGFTNESDLVLGAICGVAKEVSKIRRWLHDFEFTNYDTSYIKLVDKVLHDKIKEIEEE